MDSRERRGGSEHVVCSGSDRSCSGWFLGGRIEQKRLRSITTHESSQSTRIVPHMVGIPDGRTERLVERCASALVARDRGGRCGRASGPTRRRIPARWSTFSCTSKAWTPRGLTTTIPGSQAPGQDRGGSSTATRPPRQHYADRPGTTLTPSSTSLRPTPSTVPEPATLLLTIGMTGYALWWRRRR